MYKLCFHAFINLRVKSYSHHIQHLFYNQQVDKCDFPYPHNLAPDHDNKTDGTDNLPILQETTNSLEEATRQTSDDPVAIDNTEKEMMIKNPVLGNLTVTAAEGERASVTVFEDNSTLYGKAQ